MVKTTNTITQDAKAETRPGRVVLIAKPGNTATGVGRYSQTLFDGLRQAGTDVRLVAPAVPPLPDLTYRALRRLGVDLRAFLLNYPVWARYPRADVYHLTSQNLASLLLFRRPPGKVVVTVHDIIPYMLRDDPELSSYRTVADRLFDRLALAGLRRADRLIAISEYTKHCVVQHAGIPSERIEVCYQGVDHGRFRRLAVPASLRERYRLPEGRRYLIYVGSEDPRKNLASLLKALAMVRRELPDVELVKVGRAHFNRQREHLDELAGRLGIRAAVHFLDDVPEDDLPLLYNLAEVCVMPSLYEGFGFPVLEAMACGTPVVAARAASLPELAGDAGLLVDLAGGPAENLAAALRQVLTDDGLRASLAGKGLAQAATFRWSDTVNGTRATYRQQASNRRSGATGPKGELDRRETADALEKAR